MHGSDLSVRFANPPIHEVTIGADFGPPPASLRSEHIGLFWARIRERFPVVEHQPPLVSVDGGIGSTGNGRDTGAETWAETAGMDVVGEGGDPFPLPRYWFRSRDRDTVIQVQSNAFVFNWRNGAGYPGFRASLKPAFDEYFGIFEDFFRQDVGAPALTLDRCSLSYMNAVRQGEFWDGPKDTRRVLPGVRFPDLGAADGRPSAFDCHYSHRAAPDLSIGFTVRTARAREEPQRWVLVFEIEALGRVGRVARSVADSWYGRAHEALVDCFLSVTDEDVRSRCWQPVETDLAGKHAVVAPASERQISERQA